MYRCFGDGKGGGYLFHRWSHPSVMQGHCPSAWTVPHLYRLFSRASLISLICSMSPQRAIYEWHLISMQGLTGGKRERQLTAPGHYLSFVVWPLRLHAGHIQGQEIIILDRVSGGKFCGQISVLQEKFLLECEGDRLLSQHTHGHGN